MEGKGKITMSDITKSRFDELIEKKANERVEQLLQNIANSFPWEINGNGAPSIKFNDKCGELAGKQLYCEYSEGSLLNQDVNGKLNESMLNEYTNWPEVREELFKKYQDEETDNILEKLSGISDFLEERGDFDADF